MDQRVNIIATNQYARNLLKEGDGIVQCGNKLRFEDTKAFSILLANVYANGKVNNKAWLVSRPSSKHSYKVKLVKLSELGLDSSVGSSYSLLMITLLSAS